MFYKYIHNHINCYIIIMKKTYNEMKENKKQNIVDKKESDSKSDKIEKIDRPIKYSKNKVSFVVSGIIF